MFEKYYNGVEDLIPLQEFHPFPKISDREGWEKLSKEYKDYLLKTAEPLYQYVWPTPPASVYMDFYRNGNRKRYEHIIFAGRRLPLIYLTLAECVENKGRFIDDIINGIWSTLDEATWIIPASNPKGLDGEPQPLNDCYHTGRWSELFTNECGADIAWCYYVLHERLDEEAPQIAERMLFELNRRVIVPFMEHDDFWWQGFSGQAVNNWNPWICNNIMTVATLACKDEALRKKVIGKCLKCIDVFYKSYAPDGGCDEGPGYWEAAGGAFFSCIDILRDVTGGKLDFFDDEVLHNMCTYTYKMHICDQRVVDYADAHAVYVPHAHLLFRMGTILHDPALKQMGAALYRKMRAFREPYDVNSSSAMMYRYTKNMMVDHEIAAYKKAEFPYVRDTWFPGIQVMCARTQKGSCKGLYLSAKGGHNAESHNHNDIGSFVIYADGLPAIVDIGTAVYEKRTFNEQRYELPQMQSLYHNLPSVNGAQQKNGIEYRSSRVSYRQSAAAVDFSVGIENAYQPDAKMQQWDRSFHFDRKQNTVTVTDQYTLSGEEEVTYCLMTAVKPSIRGRKMTLRLNENTSLTVTLPAYEKIETQPFVTENDASLRASWGKQLFRTLYTVSRRTAGCDVLTVTQVNK